MGAVVSNLVKNIYCFYYLTKAEDKQVNQELEMIHDVVWILLKLF